MTFRKPFKEPHNNSRWFSYENVTFLFQTSNVVLTPWTTIGIRPRKFPNVVVFVFFNIWKFSWTNSECWPSCQRDIWSSEQRHHIFKWKMFGVAKKNSKCSLEFLLKYFGTHLDLFRTFCRLNTVYQNYCECFMFWCSKPFQRKNTQMKIVRDLTAQDIRLRSKIE